MERARFVARVLARRDRLAEVAIAALAVALTFPYFIVDVGTGLDYSWAAALHVATNRKMAFGRDIVFTYGPLGFLTAPGMYFPLQGMAALLVRLPLMGAIAWCIVAFLRRVMPLWAAAPATVVLTWAAAATNIRGGEAPTLMVMLAATLGLAHLLGPSVTHVPRWVWPTAGMLGSLTMLCKFDSGAEVLAIGLSVIVLDAVAGRSAWQPQLRLAGAFTGGSLAALVVAWAALGQPMGTLIPWVTHSLQLGVGFSDAMTADYGAPWEAGAVVMAVVGLGLLLVPLLRSLPRRHGISVALFCAVVVAGFAKIGFVRHDQGHVLPSLGALVLLAVVAVRPASRAIGVLLLGSLVVAATGVANEGTAPYLHPAKSIRMMRRIGELATSSAKRNAVIDWGHTAIPQVYPIPATMLERMRGRTVHIEPWEAVVAWTYPSIRWAPLPAFQSYLAYTPALDRLNARRYRDDRRAPEFVLLEAASIDSRVPRWESPTAMVEFICRYRIVETSTIRWQLFQRRADGSGCGARQLLASVPGGSVPVAGSDDLVVARLSGLHPGVIGSLRSLVLRPAKVWVSVGVGDDPLAPPARQRLVVATAGAPHLIAFPSCLRDALGTFDTRSFTSLAVSRAATITYERIPFRCPG